MICQNKSGQDRKGRNRTGLDRTGQTDRLTDRQTIAGYNKFTWGGGLILLFVA